MAGPLAPTINPDIGYERPVEENRGAVLGLVGDLIGSLRKPGGGSSGAAELERQRKLALQQRWTEGVEVVAAIREQKGEQAAALYERTLARNYTMAGGELDADARAAYQAITGRDSDLFGRTATDVALDDTIKTPEFQQLFIAAGAAPGVDPNDEDARASWALSRIAQREHDKLLIEDVQSEWNRSKEAAYSNELETFEQTMIGGLIMQEGSGQPITKKDLLEAKVLWEQQKARLAQPSNVTDAQYQNIKKRMDSIDKLFETFEEISDREYLFEDFANALAKASLETGDTETAMVTLAYKKNPAEMVALFNINPLDYVKKVTQASKLSFDTTPLFSQSLPARALSGDPSALPDPIARELSKLEPDDLFEVATAAASIGQASTDLNDPSSRDDFVTNYVKSGLATSKIAGRISSEDLSAMFGKDFLTKYKQLESVDPEGARRVQQAVLVGSRAERRRQENALASIESANPLIFWDDRWEGYTWNPEAVREQVGDELFRELHADIYAEYGGDVNAALADGGSRLRGENVKTAFNAVAGNLASNYDKAIEARKSLAILGGVEDVLGKPTEEQLAREVKIGNYVIPPALREQPEFLTEVEAIAGRLGADPAHLLMAMHFETGGTFRPDIPNAAGSSGIGLIQFMSNTAASLGTSTEELRNMSAVEQLHYVEKYLAPYKGRLKNFGDVYMAILYPAAIGKSDDYPLFKEGTKAYEGNAGLDRDGDGIVTRGEAVMQAAKGAMGKANVGNLTQGKVTAKRLGISDTEGLDLPRLTPEDVAPSGTVISNQGIETPALTTPTTDDAPVVDRASPEAPRPQEGNRQSFEIDDLINELARSGSSDMLYDNVRDVYRDIRSGKKGNRSIVILGRVPHEVIIDDEGAISLWNIRTGQFVKERDHDIWE